MTEQCDSRRCCDDVRLGIPCCAGCCHSFFKSLL